MSTLISGILSEHPIAHNSIAPQSVNSQTAGSNADSAGSSAAITANDFLTLLVTEMKNQDPTANTDPNEYINQLVQVNSLQQLISINQTLSSNASVKASDGIVREPAMNQTASTAEGSLITNSDSAAAITKPGIGPPYQMRAVHGNLTSPVVNPAAQRVAESLGTSSRVR